jgi:hypothetical protein
VVGAIAQRLSYGAGLAVTGSLLAVAALAWLIVPEPMDRAPAAPEPERATARAGVSLAKTSDNDPAAGPATAGSGPENRTRPGPG